MLFVKDNMDTVDLESDSDSDTQEPSDDTQLMSVKGEPLDTSSSELSDSDFKKEVEVSRSLVISHFIIWRLHRFNYKFCNSAGLTAYVI